jgi:tetratricopeptide (TPR) repeat protein
LREVAKSLSIFDQTNISENVMSWLRMNPRIDWLLVLDDVGKELQAIVGGPNHDTLFESCTLIFRSLQDGNKTLEENITTALEFAKGLVILPYPTLKDSVQILKQHSPNISWDRETAERLVTFLDFSPIAISIAAAYIEEGGITFGEYLELFQQCDLSFTPSSISTPLLRALMLSLRRLQVEKPQALEISKLMALLDRQSVVEGLLLYDRDHKNARNFYGSLRKLESMSLVQKCVENYHYSMHRLVRDFFVNYLRNEGQLEIKQQLSVELLSERYPYGDQSFWTVCQMYNPHAKKVIKYLGADVWPRAELLRSMASYHQNCGRYATAYELYQELRKIYFSNKPLSTKQSDVMVDISLRAAQMLGKMSRFDEGEKLLRDTMSEIKSEVEPGKPQLVHARSLQAWFCSWRGQHAESERLWRLCLADNIRIQHEAHVDTLVYQSNITTALIAQAKYADAEELLDRTIPLRISVRGEDHPDIIQSRQILAGVYHKQGKYKKAEDMNREILKTADRVQGSEHPDTLIIVNNLSTLLRELGRFTEAEAMQWRLLASRERQHGSEHEQVVISRINLATTLEKLGKYRVAEEQNRLALSAQKKLSTDVNHPTTLNIENSLGLVLLRQEKYDDAEPVLRKVLKSRRKVLGMEHLQTLISQNNLAGLLMKRKKFLESANLLRETIDTARKNNNGEENAFILRMMNSLSEVMRQGTAEVPETERQIMFQKALALQETALAGRIRIFGEDNPDVFTSQYNLAHLLHDMGQCIDGRELYEKAVEGLGRRLGKKHPVTIECEENFAICKSHG